MASAAISRIKSYDLKFLPTTVDLDIDNNEMFECMQTIINGTNSDCSLLLIAEKGNDLLRMMVYSADTNFNANEWMDSVTKMVNGEIISTNQPTEDCPFLSLQMKMVKSEFSATKEKENARSAAFTFLRQKGFLKDDEEEDVGNLLEEYGF